MQSDAEKSHTKTSVVVASCREPRLLDDCLKSLHPQCQEHGAEIIVARAGSEVEINELGQRYPFARFVGAPVHRTIPELRADGMAVANGEIVVLTEDHCVAASDWLPKLIASVERGTEVVGGAMDNAQRERAIDWAAYFAEYGFFAESGGGPVLSPLLTGANVAYSRRVLNHVLTQARQGEWENVIHADLLAQGRSVQFLKAAAVYQNKNYSFWDFCRDRFDHGRDYARRRLADGPTRRWLYLVGSLVLPIILIYRLAKAVGRHHRRPFLRALPITFAFLTAWAAGEAVGYWCGPARVGTDGG